MGIPVIDLKDFPNHSSKLIAACEEWGCFRLVNINEKLPETLMREMKAVVKSLFDLPEEIKLRNIDDDFTQDGYMGKTPKYPLYESFGMQDLTSPRGVDYFCSQLDATPQQRETITRYAEAIHVIAREIGKKIAESLGLKSETFKFENWTVKSRINKYHFTPETLGSFGAHVHTDSGFMTILQDDEGIGGTEVMSGSGDFVPADPVPGGLFFILGDMATVWSNGRFRNVKHRELCKDGNTRRTIASFVAGLDEILEPCPELMDHKHPSLFLPINSVAYRKLRFIKNLHAGETLALLHPDNK